GLLMSTTSPDPDGAGALTRPVVKNRYDELAMGDASNPGQPLLGLAASYYANQNLAGKPAGRETDAAVDFSWGASGSMNPLPYGLSPNNVSIRWTGLLNLAQSGHYSFLTQASDGTRLFIDGNLVIDSWSTHAGVQEARSETYQIPSG